MDRRTVMILVIAYIIGLILIFIAGAFIMAIIKLIISICQSLL